MCGHTVKVRLTDAELDCLDRLAARPGTSRSETVQALARAHERSRGRMQLEETLDERGRAEHDPRADFELHVGR